MEINIGVDNQNINNVKLKIMIFLFNALENGWSVKKRKDSYVFTKNHEGKTEMFSEDYLTTFMTTNFDVNKLLS